jgi:hypothetical protein
VHGDGGAIVVVASVAGTVDGSVVATDRAVTLRLDVEGMSDPQAASESIATAPSAATRVLRIPGVSAAPEPR